MFTVFKFELDKMVLKIWTWTMTGQTSIVDIFN